MFKTKLDTYFHSLWFIFSIVLISLVGWQFKLAIYSFSVVAVLSICILFVSKDLSPIVYVIACVTYMFNFVPTTPEFIIAFCVTLVLVAVGLVYNYFKFENDRNEKFKLDKHFWCGIVLTISMMLGGLFSEYYGINTIVFGFTNVFPSLCVYLLVKNFCSTNKFEILFRFCLTFVMLISLEMVLQYSQAQDIISFMQNKRITVSVGEINLPAIMMGGAIPVFMLKGLNSKHSNAMLILSAITYVFILFTFCRGSILFGGIMFFVSFIIVLVKTEKKKQFFICSGTMAVIAICVVVVAYNFGVFDKIIQKGLDDNGRYELWQLAWDEFLKNPFFGVGFKGVDTYGFDYTMFHSLPFQIIGSMGIVGIVASAIFFVDRYSVLYKNFNVQTVLMVLGVLVLDLYGMIDNTFTYGGAFMFAYLVRLACDEIKNNNMGNRVENGKIIGSKEFIQTI